MSQAKTLYQLQEIDLQIIRSTKKLDEIALALADNKVVQQAKKQVEIAESALKPLRTQNKNLELEIQSTASKSKATENRLYSGNVKNPKELQEMQQEIDSLKKRNDELEEQLLDIMMQIEEADDNLSEKQSGLQSITAEWETEHADLLAEKASLDDEVERLQGERDVFVADVSSSDIKLYDDMRKKKSNKPVSIMQGRSCTICGIEQTLAVEVEVNKSQSLVNCVNCGRILVSKYEI